MSTPVAERTEFFVPTQVVAPNLPAPIPKPPPRETAYQRCGKAFTQFGETSHGKAMKSWATGIGNAMGYIVPAVTLVGTGYLTAGHYSPSDGEAMFWSLAVTTVGAIGQACFQGAKDGNIASYIKEKHPHPRRASFRDVMLYFVAPGFIVGQSVAAATSSTGWGLFTGSVAALAGAALCLTAYGYRQKP